MEFDESRVLTPFTADKSKWIGWKGYFALEARYLKEYFERNDSLRLLSGISSSYSYPYKENCAFCRPDDCYAFFYPVEPPAAKSVWRPYKSIEEMHDDLGFMHSDKVGSVRDFANEVIKAKGKDTYVFMQSFDFEESAVAIDGNVYSMEEIFGYFEKPNGDPLGIYEEVEDD